jgi:RNA 2',3'-cyclic 3'-phosphodiesterase
VSGPVDESTLGRAKGPEPEPEPEPEDARQRVSRPKDARPTTDGSEPGAEARLRLFVALELPEPVRQSLIAWQASIVSARPALRAVSADGLHATLCFLGSRPRSDLEPITSVCAEIGGGATAPRLALGEALWLPVRRPRVLAVALRDVDHALARVQAALSQRLASTCGYEPEQRAFQPHVTLARVRGRERVVPESLRPPQALSFDADTLTLYRSLLRASGARYEPLLTVELA